MDVLQKYTNDLAAVEAAKRQVRMWSIALWSVLGILALTIIATVAVLVGVCSLPRAGLDQQGLAVLSEQAALAQLAKEASKQ